MPTAAVHVLFLSDRNAAYSLLAEAILRVEGNGRFRAYSAGLEPAPAASADVLNFLAARHIPVQGLHPKSLLELEAEHAPTLQFVIALSHEAAVFASEQPWRGDPLVTDWTLDEEATTSPSSLAIRDAFWTLSRRLRIFAGLAQRKGTRRSLQNRLQGLQAI